MRFKNKIAVITGASSGIGKATATLLAKEGATVVLNARKEEQLEAVAAEIARNYTSPLVIRGDICEALTLDRLVQKPLEQFGRIDIWINNAGGGAPAKPLEQITMTEWNEILNRNLSSVFRCCQKVATVFKQQQYGRIVNVSSLAGRDKSLLAGVDYSASKAGLIGMTRHLAALLASDNITVNTVAPGATLTERIAQRWLTLSPEAQQKIIDTIPLGRLGKPEDIAPAIAFLASDEASYITGAVIDVNGGCFMS
ncbi:MAG: SDR family NAD(P)-dependent oxidoreductase [Coleofasciculus sp. A1-SPW-01]|uniref:SDR family NAD(P)-dependent oxidoreductase n=1 Tax=Coleofasciculus sp. A1-SPW-01 TaxID=3070819 RepID=UPI0032FF0FF5